jgi:ankyrin repeat protein
MTHLITINNLTRLEAFLDLGVDLEVHLSSFGDTVLLPYHVFGDEIKATALIVAAVLDNVPLAGLLLQKGAKAQYATQNQGRFSPLYAAQSAEMVQLFFDHKADLNVRGIDDNTPLHWAAWHGKTEVAKILLDLSPECMKARTVEKGLMQLHCAAKQDAIDVVKLLLARWPDGIFCTDSYENTALHYAVEGSTDMVHVLGEYWYEIVKQKNQGGHTPLHVAVTGCDIKVVIMLWEWWPEAIMEGNGLGATAMHWAVRSGFMEAIRFLVDMWPEGMKAKTHWGDTPLHWAAQLRDTEVFKVLVHRWPEAMSDRNNHGQTPLDLAVKWGDPEVMQCLYEQGVGRHN